MIAAHKPSCNVRAIDKRRYADNFEPRPQHIARFTATEKAALEKAARDDARPVAALMTKIICDWLRERKYLK